MCETGRNRLNFFFFSSFIVVTVCMGGMRARDIIYYRCINCLLCQYRARLRHNALSFSKVNRLTAWQQLCVVNKYIQTRILLIKQLFVIPSVPIDFDAASTSFKFHTFPDPLKTKTVDMIYLFGFAMHGLSVHIDGRMCLSQCVCVQINHWNSSNLSLSLKSSLLNVWIMKFQYYRPICNVLVRSSASSTEKGTHRRRKRIG